MRKLMVSVLGVVLAVSCLPSEIVIPDYEEEARERKAKAQQIREAAKERGLTERETVLEVETKLRQFKKAIEATRQKYPEVLDETNMPNNIKQAFDLIEILVGFRDKQSLPLFEEMAMSKDEWVCATGIGGYIMLAGQVNALPFVDKIIKKPNCTERIRADVYEMLLEVDADGKYLSEEDDEKIIAFLQVKMETEKGNAAKALDKLLCRERSYRNSDQRKKVAERLIKSEKGEMRDHWKAIKEEIENPKPKPEREPWW